MPDDAAVVRDLAGALPFAGDGRGVRIAVIDSGVHCGHPHIERIAGGVAVAAGGVIETGEGAYIDRLGHGTAVTAAIQEKAPGASLFAVKVFHGALRTTSAVLLRAIDWCIEQEMDLVNLSLGSPNPAHEEAFAQAAAYAREAGTLLVAAREANGQICYPGGLSTVFSVGLDWDCPRHSYHHSRQGDATVFHASGYPRPAPGVPLVRNLHGISFAVANMTGLIARALETEGGAPDAARFARLSRALVRAGAG